VTRRAATLAAAVGLALGLGQAAGPRAAELAPVLAAHQDVDAIDLTGAPAGAAAELAALAAGNLKRVLAPPAPEEDWRAGPGTARLLAFLEIKTVWHPAGI